MNTNPNREEPLMNTRCVVNFQRSAKINARVDITLAKLKMLDDEAFKAIKTDTWIIPYKEAVEARDFILKFCEFNTNLLIWWRKLKLDDRTPDHIKDKLDWLCNKLTYKYDLNKIDKLVTTEWTESTFDKTGYSVYYMTGMLEGLFNNTKKYNEFINHSSWTVLQFFIDANMIDNERYDHIVHSVEKLYDKLCYIEFYLSKKLK